VKELRQTEVVLEASRARRSMSVVVMPFGTDVMDWPCYQARALVLTRGCPCAISEYVRCLVTFFWGRWYSAPADRVERFLELNARPSGDGRYRRGNRQPRPGVRSMQIETRGERCHR
jgi:hypothetical protein